MSSFTAGFAARHDAAAQALHRAFDTPDGFAPADIKARASAPRGPVSFAPQSPNPRHFHPADKEHNPTAGWDPFDSHQQPGFADPIATARAAGYAEGIAAARAEADAAAGRDHELLARLGHALRSDARIDRDRIARQLRQTVLFLVSRLVGEIGVAPGLLGERIDSAIEMLADSAESTLLRVHPDDVALLADKLPTTVFAVGDAALARGSFVLESASTIVEDSPELWLEQLSQAIERVAVPQGQTPPC